MNTAPTHIVGPALFGRYLLSPELENSTTAKAELQSDNSLAFELLNYANATDNRGYNYNKVEIQLSTAISGRDFLVLLALLHVGSTLSVGCIEGGMSFLASDLKSCLDLSNSGSNTLSIESSIERLSNIEISLVVFDDKDQNDSCIQFDCGRVIDSFSNGKIDIQEGEKQLTGSSVRSRFWYVRFGDGMRRIVQKTETTTYDWGELLTNRKSSLTIAVKAHLQTIYGTKTFSKKVSTLFRNINTPIKEGVWRSCRNYRSRFSSQLKRLSKHIQKLKPPKINGSIFYLPRLLIDF